MPTLVSTGQITIVDNNDAKPITAFIQASLPINQIYSKDDGVEKYTPNYATTNQVLTAKVYVGGTTGYTDVTDSLTSRKWYNDSNPNLGSGTTLTLTANTDLSTPTLSYYFEGDYTDPITKLQSHVIAQISLSITQTGSNAIFVQLRGQDVIKMSNTTTKNTAYMTADLVRASGVDDTDTLYQWYELPSGTPINQAMPGWASKYGFKNTADTNNNVDAGVGANVPALAGYYDLKTIIIGEPAVNSLGLYKVEVKDSDGKIYQGFFTVHDVSDMYNVILVSTAGDKLQNGQGSTDVYPVVYNGARALDAYTGWTFKWYFYDGMAPGRIAGFIDTTRTAVAGGKNIMNNTAGTSPTVTFAAPGIPLVARDMVKLVSPTGVVGYYEVATPTVSPHTTVTLKLTSMTLNLSWTTPFTTDQFAGGKLFVCKGTGATAGTQTTTGGALPSAAKITVTGDEIDVKGTIVCEANRP